MFCRKLDFDFVNSSKEARRSTRLRLHPSRKPKPNQKKKSARLHGSGYAHTLQFRVPYSQCNSFDIEFCFTNVVVILVFTFT
ncbi:unnamed protein product [Arabis nemorensis]|uniref:Uncharacterized protein n=1 Tax=Arabis nemorensis TaxID=586526 RepID=A0A565BDE1_9BRAS|nr:unnamed protein product [Arabis nemorensis]